MPVIALPIYLCILIGLACLGVIITTVLSLLSYLKIFRQLPFPSSGPSIQRTTKTVKPKSKTVYLTDKREADKGKQIAEDV